MNVQFTTNLGSFTVTLNSEKAPKTVENFLAYVKNGHYNNTIFHRVIDGFMVQGGGFDSKMNQKPTLPPVENEAANGLQNTPYTVAMARTSDPHSATAQFFINIKNNSFLNFTASTREGFGYCVFGEVTDGRETIDLIKKVPTGSRAGHQDVPNSEVIISTVQLLA
ncbi:MAG: peptidyl-prolyl cis-trans isomerase [Ferrovum sp.]|jgi:peptidyl-prolyl cis-trans isomerase B (cyclophilin B)|nr:peptidyl-prolyl cis-trans isomerase [Ferrovum sp.]